MQHREIEYALPQRSPETTDKSEENEDEDNESKNIEGAAGNVSKNDAEAGGESIEDDEQPIPDFEPVGIFCCERDCGQPADYLCVKCRHTVCIVDSVGSLHDQTERLCGHCILDFKEYEGTFVEKGDCIEELEQFHENNNELDESIDQPSNYQAPDISTSNHNVPVEERIEQESNFNLDFSFADIDLLNDVVIEQSRPFVSQEVEPFDDKNNELDESIDQPLNYQAFDISTPNKNLPVEEIIEPEANFNLDFSLSDMDLVIEQPCPYVSEEATAEVSKKDSICLFCSTEAKYLGPHLGSSDICRVKYAEKFNLGQDASVDSISNTRLKGVRKTYPSRQTEKRRVERVRRRENITNEKIDLFNKFKNKTSVSEIVFNCYKCLKLDKREKMQAVEVNLDVPNHFRLENSLWICKKCVSDEEVEIPQTSFIENFDSRVLANRNVSVPGFTSLEPQDKSLNRTFLFPSSISAASNNFGSREPKKRPDIIKKLSMGSGKFKVDEFLSPSYEHKLRQLEESSKFSSSVPGRIVDNEQKKVKIIDSNHNTENVKGSSDYYKRLNEDLKFAIYTLGSAFVVSKVQLPKVSLLDNEYQHMIRACHFCQWFFCNITLKEE